MNKAMELDNLFDEAMQTTTQNAPPLNIKNSLPILKTKSLVLQNFLNVQLPALLESTVDLEKLKSHAYRVDGQTIGTGEADFTKGNTAYALSYKGRNFQLLDVPGIEGDEKKYEHLVRQAIAKAHLVFYINGTNKKPETTTAEKIRSYLRRGTQVSTVINVRGNADTYEFEEDRQSLGNRGDAKKALEQTMEVLGSVLGKQVLLSGHCVQGLLAFSSLAINHENKKTSIHPSRNHDLVIYQRNYLKHFTSNKSMFEFSQLRTVAQVLHTKLDTFREDIIESNKVKVRELLSENIAILKKAHIEHEDFIKKIKPEFEKSRESINEALKTFERLISAGRKNLWNDLFNELIERSDAVVASNFGNNDSIKSGINKAFTSLQTDVGARMQEQLEEQLADLQSKMAQAMERLIQDVRRVDFQQKIFFDTDNQKSMNHITRLNMDLDTKAWGSIAFNVGSYAASGFFIGSAFPGIGNAIGGAVGVALGLLVSLVQLFLGKEKRIRKAQAQIQEKIEEVRDQVISELPKEMKNLLDPVRKEVKDTILNEVDTIHANLARPLHIIQQQIAMMTNTNQQLEKMPHGTIQAI